MARPQLSELLAPRGNQQGPIKVGEPPKVLASTLAEAAISEAGKEAESESETAAEAMPSRTRADAGEARSKPAPRSAAKVPTTSRSAELPPYLTFERKEARLRPDQVTQLNVKARELNKTKDRDADRITDNTLIRVAVDLILSKSKELRGGDEAQLRKSVGL